MAGVNNYTTLMKATNKSPYSDDEEQLQQPAGRNIFHRKGNRYLNSKDGDLEEDMQKAYLDSINSNQEALQTMKYSVSDHESSPLPLEKQQIVERLYDTQDEDISMKRFLNYGVQWISLLTENLLSHPFIVLRRQCQVYHASNHYHLHPLYLIPSIVHLQRRQGVTTLWKGLGSCLLVRGTSMALEDVLTKLTSWPKEVNSLTTVKRFGQHLLLKSISIALVMPFYAASLVETVQSDIASENPGIFDLFREGGLRLLYWSSPQKGRMLPIWSLIPPTVTVGITKYVFSLIMKGISCRIVRRKMELSQEMKGAKQKDDVLMNQNVEIYSDLISMVITEIVFFPLETIIHRLQLQGTRTIIDNLDNGYAVVPILTSYHGLIDCYKTTVAMEGFSGLYKGFGAMLLQFAAHIAVIKLTKWAVGQINELLSSRPPSKVIEYYNLDRGITNSTSISPSLSCSPSGSSDLQDATMHRSLVIEEDL